MLDRLIRLRIPPLPTLQRNERRRRTREMYHCLLKFTAKNSARNITNRNREDTRDLKHDRFLSDFDMASVNVS